MRIHYIALTLSIPSLFMISCSRKEHAVSSSTEVKKTENKTVVKKVAKTPLPKIITVDDRAAKKTPDGRLYYDLEGKRYWRNYDDGKYYLFNKAMYNDPSFKPH
jgi:hypothetical protein